MVAVDDVVHDRRLALRVRVDAATEERRVIEQRVAVDDRGRVPAAADSSTCAIACRPRPVVVLDRVVRDNRRSPAAVDTCAFRVAAVPDSKPIEPRLVARSPGKIHDAYRLALAVKNRLVRRYVPVFDALLGPCEAAVEGNTVVDRNALEVFTGRHPYLRGTAYGGVQRPLDGELCKRPCDPAVSIRSGLGNPEQSILVRPDIHCG